MIDSPTPYKSEKFELAPEGSPERADARHSLMIWAKRARRRAENANVWIQNVYQAAPSLVAICGLEDVTRIANYVWSEND